MLPIVDDKTPKIWLSRGVVLSQSTFHLVINLLYLLAAGYTRLKCNLTRSPASTLAERLFSLIALRFVGE